jgi:hypothetical protein
LSFSYWPKRHNFFGFTYGITDRYIRSLWNETKLMAYDDGNLSVVQFCGQGIVSFGGGGVKEVATVHLTM